MDAPLTEKPDDSFPQAEAGLPQSEILSKDAGPLFTFFFRCFSHSFGIHLFLFINSSGQASAPEVAYIFKVFWTQKLLNGCLVV